MVEQYNTSEFDLGQEGEVRTCPVLEMPDFFMEADAEEPAWLGHLNEHGYVVVKNVLTQDEVSTGVDKYWDFLQNNYNFMRRKMPEKWENGGELVPKDVRTLHNQNWPVTIEGFSSQNYSNHSEFAWYCRTRPAIKRVFQQIWKTDQLLCSFDTVIAWRQWWLSEDANWEPRTEGLHLDQNLRYKKGRQSVQGMLLLQDIDERIGGLEIVPGSFQEEMQKYIKKAHEWNLMCDDDFLSLRDDQNISGTGRLVKANAGDLILWDSRVIHGGTVGPGYTRDDCPLGLDSFARFAATVCMTPKAWADEGVLEQRRKAFEMGFGLSHWPHEYHKAGWGGYEDKVTDRDEDKLYKPVELTDTIQDLIG